MSRRTQRLILKMNLENGILTKYFTSKESDLSTILHSTQLALNANLFGFLEILLLCEITEKQDSSQAT